uniref:Uncharacterized protein n=1 Tax=Setaria viridis TaxID=4556 RepID=A0A4V6D198_SETVI|nr:hypothetical protein SEVIR_9G255200v2 [Setaria viridis]
MVMVQIGVTTDAGQQPGRTMTTTYAGNESFPLESAGVFLHFKRWMT